ncbi:MAG TPA: SpoIIE family protein phosphatase [Solirubrobacteraceae bacterium]|nr:SpoIIE family protein phosphatase [Solirubrobacteraceae bacterium]
MTHTRRPAGDGGREALWLAVAVVLTTVIGALDALVGGSAIFIGALVVGPLLAAARTDALLTACVGAYAVVLALLVGFPNGMFGTEEHLLRCLPVAIGAIVGVWIGGLRRSAETATRELAASRDELEVILRGVADGITAEAPDGSLLYVNDSAVRTLGFDSAEELLATPTDQVLERFEVLDEHGEPFPLERLPGRLALAGHDAQALVRYRVRATGVERWTVVKARPVSRSGPPEMAINIMEDVTETRREEQSERLLAGISRLLGASLDHETLLRTLADAVVPDLADWCSVELLDERGVLRCAALAHTDPDRRRLARELRERHPPDPEVPGGIYAVVRTGEALLVPELPPGALRAAASDAEDALGLEEIDLRSAIIVPLTARGRTLGALALGRSGEGNPFDEGDLNLALDVAARAAFAVDNARLFRASAETARALQDSLLPPVLPEIPGIEVASRFRAAGEGNEVGGDFYDLFEVGDGAWVLVVGDVVGKGAEAAAVTALARYTMRAAAMAGGRPDHILAVLNEAILRQRTEAEFCTVCAGRLEPVQDGGMRLAVVSGGHPLPVLVPADGPARFVGRPGTLLGVMPEPVLTETAVDVVPGDTVIFYTDGVTEAGAPERVSTPEELLEVAVGTRGLDPAAVAERIERFALSAGPELRDDLAILVARVEPRAVATARGEEVSWPGEARRGRPRSPAARPGE